MVAPPLAHAQVKFSFSKTSFKRFSSAKAVRSSRLAAAEALSGLHPAAALAAAQALLQGKTCVLAVVLSVLWKSDKEAGVRLSAAELFLLYE